MAKYAQLTATGLPHGVLLTVQDSTGKQVPFLYPEANANAPDNRARFADGTGAISPATYVPNGTYIVAYSGGSQTVVVSGATGAPADSMFVDLATQAELDAAGTAASGTYALVAGAAANASGKHLARARTSARDVKYDGNVTMASPPTIGAFAAATAITSAKFWPATSNSSGTIKINRANFAYSGGANIQPLGATFPDPQFIQAKDLQGQSLAIAYNVDFMFDGTQFELYTKNLSGYSFRIWVDGQIAGSATNAGSNFYLPVTFATRAVRRIRIETSSGVFGGINTGPNDSVWKPQVNGPRVIVVGDSYIAGTGATYGGASCMTRTLAAAMGWQDVWLSALGGTGYLNAGSNVTFRSRLATDVIANSPDLIIWAGGHNDTASSQAAIQAEAALCFAQVAAALPDCQQIVLAPLWAKGVASFTAGLYGVRDGLKAAALAAGLPFVDLLEIPLDVTGTSTTLSSTATASATISIPAIVPVGGTVHVGAYPAGERRKVTAVSGAGPFTHTLSTALTGTYGAGTAVTEVGASLYTGTGRVGATTGDGNADLLTFTDDVHPSQAGHDVYGMALATEIARYALPAA